MSKKYGKVRGPKTPEQIKKSQKKSTIIIGVCAIAAMGSMLVLPQMMKGKDTKPEVSLVQVKKDDITSYLDTSGTVTSLKTKTYFSPVNANIKDYQAKVGQLVKTGDLLVSFYTDTLEADNKKAELTASATINNNNDTIEKANKTINEASVAGQNVSIIENDITNFKNYISNLNAAIANRTQDLASQAADSMSDASAQTSAQLSQLNSALAPAAQKAALESTNTQLQADIEDLKVQKSQVTYSGDTDTAALLDTQIQQKSKLLESNQKEITKLTTTLGQYADMTSEEIQNQITALSQSSIASGAGDATSDAQIAQWQQDLSDAQSTLADLQSDLAEAKAKVDAGDAAQMTAAAKTAVDSNNNMAELESASVEELLAKGKKGIQAEFNGIVTKADLTQGAAATQGLELVTLSSNRDVAVEATVSKYDYDKLKEGQKADITIGNNSYKGTVSAVNKVAEKNEKGAPVITCEVKIDNPDDEIFLGVEAKVTITTASKKQVLTIPATAVNTGKDGTFCYTVEDGKIARKDVTTGISSSDETEIIQGLKNGDGVLEQLPDGCSEGTEVTVSDK